MTDWTEEATAQQQQQQPSTTFNIAPSISENYYHSPPYTVWNFSVTEGAMGRREVKEYSYGGLLNRASMICKMANFLIGYINAAFSVHLLPKYQLSYTICYQYDQSYIYLRILFKKSTIRFTSDKDYLLYNEPKKKLVRLRKACSGDTIANTIGHHKKVI